MRVEELRIGNIIETPMGCQSIGGVCQAETPYIRLNGNMHIGYRLTNCKPIPLTEDILLKCGFVSKGKNLLGHIFAKSFVHYYVTNKRDNFAFRMNTPNDTSVFIREIEYLHELQNLYFAITGEELEVKL